MLRSFNYAAQAALLRHTTRRRDEFRKLLGFARSCERQLSSLFLKTYCEALNGRGLLPAENDLTALLEIHLLERAIHEMQYEIRYRPEWMHIPIRGLLEILD